MAVFQDSLAFPDVPLGIAYTSVMAEADFRVTS